ncbi:MAG: 2-amino-4-hydroxy-6-hydroxymethyldihydropteridine diphosphokinase [Chloroflexi bacterium]|nr:2-amino-4-hydroxy-6-hydroxymethyldihydropteridine diphosphokinase [Chloroflexota bacterium]
MGDRAGNLKKALELLSQRMEVGEISSVYETEPVGVGEQPRYLNMVCRVTTGLTPQGLLLVAKGIEQRMGRTGNSFLPRPIDIDILLYGGQVIETPDLTVPHPRMTERAFVLAPFAEIAPGQAHPKSGKTIKELLGGLGEVKGVFKVGRIESLTKQAKK